MATEKRTLIGAVNPVWANEEHTCIVLIARFKELPHIPDMVFAAWVDDFEEHGRDIFNRAASGEFGEVCPYIPGRENVLHIVKLPPGVVGASK
jgi:hypothetical protein